MSGDTAATYCEVIAEAEPVTITLPEVERLVAALGMACKLATERIGEDPADAADAIVGIGADVRTNENSKPVAISGRTLVYSRTVLTRHRTADGRYLGLPMRGVTPGPAQPPAPRCRGLTAELNVVGGRLARSDERPADQR
ncbi:hypothetical protein [Micromonospora sp. CPCC 205558]|uniref:hypothetical protein n=1 Tax=Micromonospora sp. CPCC 205558 TaxID=3122403 RepID=UPI002FF34CB0